MSRKTIRSSEKAKTDTERQQLLEGIRARIRLSPGLWFETHGAIEPKLGSILKVPELRVTALQKRKNDIVKFCILNDIPCRILTLKCRQDGSSTFAVAIGYRWLSNMRANGCIIGGSHDQGANLFRKLRIFAEHDDFDPRNKCHVLDRKARWPNGSLMEQFTAGNPEVGRSGTYQVAICTEVARWAEEGVANAADILAGLLKCVPNERLTFVELESTARGQSGDFYERWQNAITFDELKASKRGFVKVFAAWFEAPERRLNPAFEQDREQCVPPEKVEELRKRYALDDRQIAWMQWAVREECAKDFDKFCEDYPFDPESAFRTSGRRRFNATNLQRMVERSLMFPPEFGNIELVDNRAVWRDCQSNEARVVRWEQPKGNCRYLLSVDPMTGETQVGGKDPDNHAAGVLRAGYFDPNRGWIPPKLVARLVNDWGLWERQKKYELRWDIDVLEEQIWRLAQYYGNCLIVPEANMDRGLIELLKLRGSANIFVRKVFNRREQTEQKAYGWQTTTSTREMIIENLARAIREQGKDAEGIDIFCPITLSELETFVVKASGRSEAMPGKHDDLALQIAIGLTCIDGATTFIQPITVPALPPDLIALEREEDANARSGMAMRW
jgi:hypothetical protein